MAAPLLCTWIWVRGCAVWRPAASRDAAPSGTGSATIRSAVLAALVAPQLRGGGRPVTNNAG